MKKVNALFFLNEGAGNRAVFVCIITEPQFEERFGGQKEYIRRSGQFMLAEANVPENEVWDLDRVKWELPTGPKGEVATPDTAKGWPNCLLYPKS